MLLGRSGHISTDPAAVWTVHGIYVKLNDNQNGMGVE